MTTALHARLVQYLRESVLGQLRTIKDKGSLPSASLARRITYDENRGIDKWITFETEPRGLFRKSPDLVFWDEDTRFPSVIFEVAFSQPTKKLARRADEYIQRSNGAVHVVVGLKVDYPTAQKAWLYVWEAKGVYRAEEVLRMECVRHEVCPITLEFGNPMPISY